MSELVGRDPARKRQPFYLAKDWLQFMLCSRANVLAKAAAHLATSQLNMEVSGIGAEP